jgi:hypothetical protein
MKTTFPPCVAHTGKPIGGEVKGILTACRSVGDITKISEINEEEHRLTRQKKLHPPEQRDQRESSVDRKLKTEDAQQEKHSSSSTANG